MSNSNSGTRPVSDSKADLVSIEVSETNNPSYSLSSWNRRTKLERLLIPVIFVLLAVVAVMVAVSVINNNVRHKPVKPESSERRKNVCNTPGCISAAHQLIQNMDPKIDPCHDFYEYACGGFEARVRKYNYY